MSENEKGKRFLQLIEEQNKIQWDILQKLSFLIQHNWNSSEIQNEIENLLDMHKKIAHELNGLDNSNSLL